MCRLLHCSRSFLFDGSLTRCGLNAGGDTKLAESLTEAGEKTAEWSKKSPKTTTTTTTKKVDSHYVS